MTEQPSPQDAAQLAWARAARAIVLAAWALAALTPGVAVALAQYTSFVYGLHSPLYTVALLIACFGVGLALLGWVFSWVVRIRLGRAGYRFGETTVLSDLIAVLSGVPLLIAGAVLAAWGGNSDSRALPALLALGLGVAGVVGGVVSLVGGFLIGVVWALAVGRPMYESEGSRAMRELVDAFHKAQREERLEAARREGRDVAAIRRAEQRLLVWFWLKLLGTVVGGVVLLGNSLLVLPVASLFHLSALDGLLLVLVIGALLTFVSFHALLIDMLPATGAPQAAQRRYALSTAIAFTTAVLLIGIVKDTSLPFLALIPFVALLVVERILRKLCGVAV